MGCTELGFAHCLVLDPATQSVRVGYHSSHVNVQTRVELFAVIVYEAEVMEAAYHETLNMLTSADATF